MKSFAPVAIAIVVLALLQVLTAGSEYFVYLSLLVGVNVVLAVSLNVINGMTGQMLVALGEDGIKTMEDFAGCASDDLVGWSERKDGETKKFEGLFSKLEVSRVEAERMVLQARLAAGWITEEDLAREEEALEVVEGAEQDA